MKEIINNGLTLKVVGIMKPNSESTNQTSGEVGYTKELTEFVINEINLITFSKLSSGSPIPIRTI